MKIFVQFVSDVGEVLMPSEPHLKASSYTGGCIVRLMTLGHLQRSLALSQGTDMLDWSTCSLDSFQMAFPDQQKLIAAMSEFRHSDAHDALEVM